MKDYTLTVGLEIHVELATRTKMFCNSRNDSNEKRPNVNICPVCVGYPGTLPVINKEAVKSVLRLGLAVGGEIADYTEFDRKNYFYPDIPKGYQISQYKHPLVSGGQLMGVKLTRIHLEEDTARSIHVLSSPQNDTDSTQNNAESIQRPSASSQRESATLVDFNRAGVPLMELVTEPVIKTAREASNFARELQLLLKYLDVSGANMEKGEMRVEANVSVAPRPQNGADNTQKVAERDSLRNSASGQCESAVPLGTKVEVKNLNSFKVVEKAIKFEMERQIEMLEKGERVVQETRGWDENKKITFSQRLKESAHDYRYFPDPDLPKLFTKEVLEFGEEILRASLPELPSEKRTRLLGLGISPEHVEIYVTQPEWGRMFDEVSKILTNERMMIRLASNYITSDLRKPIPAESLAEIVKMISAGEISSRGAKDILKIIQEAPLDSRSTSSGQVARGKEVREIAEEKNLLQESDRGVLKKIAEEVLKENPEAPTQFLIGQAMKKSRGRANPVILEELLNEKGRKRDDGRNGNSTL